MTDKEKYINRQKKFLGKIFPIEKLPEYIQKNLTKHLTFRHELTIESDRGCALLAASYLDSLLERGLRHILYGGKNHLDNLFDFNGPLGTFSGRIAIGFSLGILSKNEFNDLSTIRKIRNEFGHSPLIIDFKNEKISSQCNNLKLIARESAIKPRQKFNTSVSFLTGSLEALIFTQKPFEEKTKDNLEEVKRTVGISVKTLVELFKKE